MYMLRGTVVNVERDAYFFKGFLNHGMVLIHNFLRGHPFLKSLDFDCSPMLIRSTYVGNILA